MLCKRGLCGHAVSVCPSRSCILSKRKNISSKFFHHLLFPYQTAWQYSDGNPPNGVVKRTWGRQKSQFWAYIWLNCRLLSITLQQTRCCQHGRQWTTATVPQVECDTSLVVRVGVDCRRRRQNVYDKKRQRYAKDNRTAYLTARRDKSVAYVTNNKRLYSTFCTVEANYWQTRSIAQALCDSRATCTYFPRRYLTPHQHRTWSKLKSCDRFEHGCIPINCGMQLMI